MTYLCNKAVDGIYKMKDEQEYDLPEYQSRDKAI